MSYNRSNQQGSLKPEYALRRINDLIASGRLNNDKEKKVGLDQLHAVIGVKRKGTWTKIYESLMRRHIELCVDLRDHHVAKDGLHQYRNLCQSVEPSSLENIVLYLMELSEARATEARQKADKVALAAAARIRDLDQEESPESIMLSSMTEEGSKERTDREVVVPWLKFLWENYRAILELLYKIPKLEKVYHRTCEKAFKFCLDYSRVTEFRRLCEMLRTHLNTLQKIPVPHPNRTTTRPQWEWTPEALEFHLNTRFAQLEVASSLELWNEGYRTVEDIYAIIVQGKKTPKPKLMLAYYEKLAKIFWVSENKLFHGYALFRHYCLSCDARKDLKQEEKSAMAASVLLSALTVPSFKDIYGNITGEDQEDIVVDKNSQMALLLDFDVNPSRQSLLNDIVARGILDEVSPEVVTLYECLEVKFAPLGLIKNVLNAVELVKGSKDLTMYSQPLTRIVVLKVMQQLSKVYSSVKLDFVYNLVSSLKGLTKNQIERILVEGVVARQLQLKVNHSAGSIQFLGHSSAHSHVDVQLSQFGSILNRVCTTIDSITATPETKKAKAELRGKFLYKVLKATEEEYNTCMERKAQIERRKEHLEKIQVDRANREKEKKDIEEERRKREEAERLEEETRLRNLEKQRKAQEQMEIVLVQKELEKYGVNKSIEDLTEMAPSDRRGLIADAQAEAAKTKEEEYKKITEQARRLDHITRALRMEGSSAIKAKYATQLEEDKVEQLKREEELQATYKVKHAADLVEKARLSRMQAYREDFESDSRAAQLAIYKSKLSKMRMRAIQEKRDANIAKARRLRDEELERIELEEQRIREEEAKAERSRLEQEQHENLRIQRMKEEQAERQQESIEERMRRQIADAEAATNAAREAGPRPGEAYGTSESKAAAPAPAAPAPAGGAYVPPGSRGGAFGGPRPGPGEGEPAGAPHRGMGRDRDMGMGRDRDMGMGRDRDMGMGRDRDMGMGRDRDMGMGRGRDMPRESGAAEEASWTRRAPAAPSGGEGSGSYQPPRGGGGGGPRGGGNWNESRNEDREFGRRDMGRDKGDRGDRERERDGAGGEGGWRGQGSRGGGDRSRDWGDREKKDAPPPVRAERPRW